MKLLSDFDGVWTNPEAEAGAQGEYLEQALLSWTPDEDRQRAADWLRLARDHVRREPGRYGWAPAGRLSAFGDEDPFAVHSGLLHYLHLQAGSDPVARDLHAAILAQGFADLDRFGGDAHRRGVERVAAERGPGILPDAAAGGRRLLESGHEVVVVSNSGTDKLSRWFEHAGLPATVHPERRAGALRLRGSARKFELDPAATDLIEVGALRIDVARPAYAAILAAERPDAVVGDVFSLDLALPLALRRRDPEWRDVRLFWLIQPYTPDRIRRDVTMHAREIEPIEGGFAALAGRLMASG
jgi:hypothetical protein